MKNLFFIMMAILLVNVSYAGEVGEEMASNCGTQIQKSRFAGEPQEADQAPAVPSTPANSTSTVR